MSERFEALPEEKKQKILDACLKEFASCGYDQASTNRIIKAAGISKGLLFHYFESKKNLYMYILDLAIKRLMERIQNYAKDLPDDIFELLSQYTLIKIRVGIEEPLLYKILYDAFVNYPLDIKSELMERYSSIFAEQQKELFAHMDTSLFREDVNPQTVIGLIMSYFDAYYRSHLESFKKLSPERTLEELDPMKKEMMEALDIIKRGSYK